MPTPNDDQDGAQAPEVEAGEARAPVPVQEDRDATDGHEEDVGRVQDVVERAEAALAEVGEEAPHGRDREEDPHREGRADLLLAEEPDVAHPDEQVDRDDRTDG